jgi:hypothetical protein
LSAALNAVEVKMAISRHLELSDQGPDGSSKRGKETVFPTCVATKGKSKGTSSNLLYSDFDTRSGITSNSSFH